jgi:hypothetical protein
MSSFQEDVSLLKLGVLFMLHHPLEDINFATEAESCAIEAIGGKQQLLDANVHPRQLDRLMLPKAVDYLHHNAEATMYQMSWKSKHGSAHLCVEKTSKEMMGAPRATTQQGLRNNSNAFMVCEVEGKTTNVINLGVTAQRVVSSLISLALVRTALNARR